MSEIKKGRKNIYSKEDISNMIINYVHKYNKILTRKEINESKEIVPCFDTVRNILGGMKKIVKDLNLEEYKTLKTKEKYIKIIQDKYNELKRPPKMKDIKICYSILHYFNGWNNALIAAGVNIEKKKKIYVKKYNFSDEELLELIRIKAKELNKTPSCDQVPYLSIIRKRFGSWNNAIELIGLKPNMTPNKYSKDFLAKIMINFTERHNKVPTEEDVKFDNWIKINYKTIENTFNMKMKDIIELLNLKSYIKENNPNKIKNIIIKECKQRNKLLSKRDFEELSKTKNIPNLSYLLRLFNVSTVNELWYKLLF